MLARDFMYCLMQYDDEQTLAYNCLPLFFLPVKNFFYPLPMKNLKTISIFFNVLFVRERRKQFPTVPDMCRLNIEIKPVPGEVPDLE